MINFPKEKSFVVLKSNWESKKSIKRFAKESAKLIESTAKFANTKKVL